MPKVICSLENASEVINGVQFVKREDGESSISVGDVVDPELSIFLSIPGYSVAEAEDQPEQVKEPEQPKETAAQRKARLKAEEAAAAAAAQPAATEEAAKEPEKQAEQPADGEKTEEDGEVF